MPNHDHFIMVPSDVDGLAIVRPVLDRIERFADLIEATEDAAALAAIRAAETTGRPLGTAEFVADLEHLLGRPFARRAAGRKPAQPTLGQPSLW